MTDQSLDITLIIYDELFAHIMLHSAFPDPQALLPQHEKFHIAIKDPFEESIILEQTKYIEEMLAQRGDPSLAIDSLRLIRVYHERDHNHALTYVVAKLGHELILQNIEVTLQSSYDYDYILVSNTDIEAFIDSASKVFTTEHASIHVEPDVRLQ